MRSPWPNTRSSCVRRRTREPAADPVRSHVGYYLVDAGRPQLERLVRYRPTLRTRFVRAVLGLADAVLSGGDHAVFRRRCWAQAPKPGRRCCRSTLRLPLFLFLLSLPASEIALALTSSLVVTICPPRLLAQLGVRGRYSRRSIARWSPCPCCWTARPRCEQLLEDLEVRALANPDPNLYFALLTDHTDAAQETLESDARAGRAGAGRHRGAERAPERRHAPLLAAAPAPPVQRERAALHGLGAQARQARGAQPPAPGRHGHDLFRGQRAARAARPAFAT